MTYTSSPGTSVEVEIPSEEELLERARKLIPFLRERAADIDAERSVPPDVIDAIRDAGLFKVVQPRQFGGYGHDLLTFMRVVQELARGGSSGSAAWVYLVLGAHQGTVAALPQCMEEVWGEDDSVLISSSYVPRGTCKKVDGGYVVGGEWPTSSGCRNAGWALVGAHGPGLDGQDDHLGFFIPLDEGEIVDDWHAMGLQGTASCTITFEGAFVPDHRVTSLTGSRNGLPFWLMATAAINSVIIGFGQSAIDVCIEMVEGKKRSYGTGFITDDLRVQERLGHAQAVVNGCRSRLEGVYREAVERVVNGEGLPPGVLANFMDLGRIGQQVQQAVLSLYNTIGPSVVLDKYPFERVFRDTLAASVHPQARFEDEPVELGRQLLGHPDRKQ
ncbi:acyl-CoA dehydrogenase family protein [Candidatus Poriferisodalis sp.]|uniref:acyl-CoA dehydrogenase family protein n=1 Tax=Candidatus Poriferisodalis sp. TaxID=3101277 RepID=UPI003B012442